MPHHLNPIFLLIVISLNGLPTSAQVEISGRIHSYDGQSKVFYFTTVDGMMSPYWTDIYPDSKGRFKIKVDHDQIGTTLIGFDNLSFRFIHRKNSKIGFEVDQSLINFPQDNSWERAKFKTGDSIRNKATIDISGDLLEINKYYNQLDRTAWWNTTDPHGNSLHI